MGAVYLTLLVCTAIPVLALDGRVDAGFMVWLVFALVLVKAVLLVEHFMEMRHAPLPWRVATHGWALVVVGVLLVVHSTTT